LSIFNCWFAGRLFIGLKKMQDKGAEDAVDETSLVSHTTTRRVMKHFLNETKTVSNEAVTCLSKATEHFMLHFVAQVVSKVDRPSGPREIRYDDIVRVVHSDPMCEFLAEMIPNVKVEAIHVATKAAAAQHDKSGHQPSKKQKMKS
jgi:hypothetical protein